MNRHFSCGLFSRLAVSTARLDGFESPAAAFDLGENVLGLGGPHERLGLLIPLLDKARDDLDEIGDAGEAAAADRLAGELRKPALHQIEPARTGRDKVQFETRMPGEPALHPL